MSYAIVRVQKFSAGSVGGIQIHDKRLKDGISHTNQDIDWTKTHLNYNLADPKNYHKAIKQRINNLNLKKAVRKDAVVMAQVLVTSDHDFFKNLNLQETKKFFQDSYAFLAERYGKDNIISATVHLDERTPHMHFNFVPVTSDGRLSAKSVFTRQSLIEQQTTFHQKVGMQYGLQRGEQGGKKKHLPPAEYKVATAFNELKELEAKKADLSNEISLMQGKILSSTQIMSIEPKKGFGRSLKDISMDEFAELKGMALRYSHIAYELEQLKNDYIRLQNKAKEPLNRLVELSDLKKDNWRMTEELDYLKRKARRMEKAINSDRELKVRYENALLETSILNRGKTERKSPQLTR